MNIGVVTNITSKGQIVIPKEYRDGLGITPKVALNVVLQDQIVCIAPISQVMTKQQQRQNLLRVLERTQGSWGPASRAEIKREKQRRKLELAASRRNRNAW